MTETSAVGAAAVTVGGWVGPEILPPAPMLSSPTVNALDPTDALGMMLASMQEMNQLWTSQTERTLSVKNELLGERMDEFLKKIQEAIEAAKRAAEEAAEEDDGGWFGDIVDCVADVAGSIVGTVADFVKDAVEAPFEVAYTAVTNPGNLTAALDTLKTQLLEMSQNGETADSVKGFTKAVANFSVDLAAFVAKATAAMAQSALTGESPWDAIKDEAKALWESFDKNILKNPDVWATTALLLKGAAITGAVMSGGALAVAALALMTLCEVDRRSGFVEHAVGKDAAPWVRLGMHIGASVCLGLAAMQSPMGDALKYAQAVATIVGGAGQISQGIAALKEGEREADAIERQANVTEALNRIHQLQRMIDDLIELLKQQAESRNKTSSAGQSLFEAKATMQSSALMRA